jgi:hypothetical protein
MTDQAMTDQFDVEDLDVLGRYVVDAWGSAVDRDWSVPAGTLEWTCWTTADHTVDCVFSYALFLASRRQDSYPPFGELHALESASPADLVQGLHAVTTMLSAIIRTSAPDTRAVLLQHPPTTGGLDDFAARGALEMVLHGHDVSAGLGVAFDPPPDVCARLLDQSATWGVLSDVDRTDDPWSDLLERSGRARVARPPAP